MNSRFLALYEHVYQRFQQSGVLAGDVIKFRKDFKTSAEYKSLNPDLQKKIDELLTTDQHIKVIATKPKMPGSNANQSTVGYADIAIDQGGGRFTEIITIPVDFVEVQDFGPNLPPIPDSFKRKDKVNIKPEPVEVDKEHPSNQTDRGTGKYMQTDITLPSKNTSIPTNVNPSMKTPDVSPSYTSMYTKGI